MGTAGYDRGCTVCKAPDPKKDIVASGMNVNEAIPSMYGQATALGRLGRFFVSYFVACGLVSL